MALTNRRLALALLVVVPLAGCGHPPPITDQGVEAFQRGYAALQAADWPEAERYFEAAAKVSPDDPFIQLDLGVVRQRLGKLDEARAAYRRAIELGKGVKLLEATDRRYVARTVAELAGDDLAGLEKYGAAGSGGAAQR